MTNLLLVLSKDPYTTETPDLVLDIGLNAKEKAKRRLVISNRRRITAARKSGVCEINSKLLKRKHQDICR